MKAKLIFIGCMASLVLTGCGTKKAYQERHYVLGETYVHKYGMEVQPGEWMTRGQSGQVISELDNGVTVTKCYSDGILNGETSYTYPHSDRVQKVEVYNMGNLSKVILHDPNGHPMFETQYLGNDNSLVTHWYEGGSPRSQEQYHGDSLTSGTYYTPDRKVESQFDGGAGLRILRNESGELLCHENVMGGMTTKRTLYYQNGAPKEVIPISNGKINGIKKTYLSQGEPSTIEQWASNAQHGVTTVFRAGEKYAEVPYYNGKKHGIERRFRDGNMVVEEITWENDLMHGPYNTYLNGTVKTEWFFYGQRVTKASFDIQARS